jgi:hypothetical protein
MVRRASGQDGLVKPPSSRIFSPHLDRTVPADARPGLSAFPSQRERQHSVGSSAVVAARTRGPGPEANRSKRRDAPDAFGDRSIDARRFEPFDIARGRRWKAAFFRANSASNRLTSWPSRRKDPFFLHPRSSRKIGGSFLFQPCPATRPARAFHASFRPHASAIRRPQCGLNDFKAPP